MLSSESLASLASLEVFLVSTAMLLLPLVERSARRTALPMAFVVALVAVASWAPSGVVAFAALAAASLVHAFTARAQSRTAAATLVLAGLLAGACSFLLSRGQVTLAFGCSLVAIALRAGVMPLHLGVAHLSERAPALQVQQFSSTLALVFAHLRFVDHHPAAYDAAPMLVRLGALLTLVPALLALVQRDLRGFYRCTVLVHGGMLLAAVGAAGHGHYAAALLVAVTTCVAVGGLGLMVSAVEERSGTILLTSFGGRVHGFPLLGASFAFLGAAGVAMPGTAGFIADDLFLHALWDESAGATALVVVASACLAIATLTAYARVFLGPRRPVVAPDLLPRERAVVILLVLVLVAVGAAPAVVLRPAEALLG